MRREQNPQTRDWTFTIGHKELVVHQRYEVLSILNDFYWAYGLPSAVSASFTRAV